MKKAVLASLIVFCFIALLGCQKKEATEGRQPVSKSEGKLKVVTTLFPLYDFTKAIAGDKAEVKLLLPPGVEPHSFEPKPEDMVRISKADVVVYTNKYMEPWAVKILETIPTKPEVVDAGKGVTLLKAGPEEGEGHHAGEHHEGGVDPHIWLDFQNAQVMVQNIADGLMRKDPANRDYYAARAQSYQQELKKLDEDFKKGLATCRIRTFLHAGHFAFGYLAHRYDLKYRSAQALNPDSEPTPQKLAELVKEMRKSGLKYIYCEELLSPATAEMIARETGSQVLLLNGAHNIGKGDLEKGTSFISLMRKNLENLRKGMECT
jgi:zinc transport system substrate-binding protein